VRTIKKHPLLVECLVWLLGLSYLIYSLREMLLLGQATLTHDNLFWHYPIFNFFARNMAQGHFPFWNPFEHGGEPFYPLITQSRSGDPLTILTIVLGRFFTNDVLILFNWNHVVMSVWMAFGIYLVFRPLAQHLLIRLSLIPILLFSSIFLGAFRQDGLLCQFFWVPYIVFFLLRILYYKKDGWRNWILLGVTIGINWQSYFFASAWLFLLLFFLGLLFFKRELLIELFKKKYFIHKFALTSTIILLMMLPNIVLFLENNQYVFPARMVDFQYKNLPPQGGPVQYEPRAANVTSKSGVRMPYSYIMFTGSFSTLWDFLQIIAPSGNMYVQGSGANSWGTSSEAYMYIGFLPWSLALLGLILGCDPLKRVWAFLLISFGLFMLGPSGGVHRLLYFTFPPLWFVRHTHTFVLFFIFPLLYFYILGCNHIFTSWNKTFFPTSSKGKILKGLFFALIFTQIGLVFYYCKDPVDFGKIALQFFFIPWALFIWMRKKQAPRILGALFLITITADLIYQFHEASYLYEKKQDASTITNSDRSIKKFTPPKNREVYPTISAVGGQQQRYYGLLNLQPYAFSPLFEETYYSTDPFEFALRNRRWNSLLLLKGYFSLVNSDHAPSQLKKLFAIEKPPFQFNGNSFNYTIKEDPYFYDSFSMQVITPTAVKLFWSDGYDKNWRAYVDGKEVPIALTNLNFKSMDLPSGTKNIDFSYEPTWFKRSLYVFYGTILLSLVGSILILFWDRYMKHFKMFHVPVPKF